MYEGEIKNNLFDGYGIYKYLDGRKYLGQWKQNHIEGYGEMYWSDWNIYRGFYKKDKKDGFGIYFYYNEDCFNVGFWKNGKQDGFGQIGNKYEIKYGFWKNGKLEKFMENIPENEFFDKLKNNNIDFCYFKWSINQLKSFFDIK